MRKKYIEILYRLVSDKIIELGKEEYTFTNPDFRNQRVSTINDGTVSGYHLTKAVETVTGLDITRNGSFVKFELSTEENQSVSQMNNDEMARMYSDKNLLIELTEIKKLLEKELKLEEIE